MTCINFNRRFRRLANCIGLLGILGLPTSVCAQRAQQNPSAAPAEVPTLRASGDLRFHTIHITMSSGEWAADLMWNG